MKSDMLMKISGISGESVDAVHKNAIHIDDLTWNIEQSVQIDRGNLGCNGRSNVKEVRITKSIDKASPVLRAQACIGTCYDSAIIIKRKAGSTAPLEYWKLTLKNVIVSGINSHLADGSSADKEVISLSFSEYLEEYTPQNEIGSGLGAVKQGYDIVKNKKL